MAERCAAAVANVQLAVPHSHSHPPYVHPNHRHYLSYSSHLISSHPVEPSHLTRSLPGQAHPGTAASSSHTWSIRWCHCNKSSLQVPAEGNLSLAQELSKVPPGDAAQEPPRSFWSQKRSLPRVASLSVSCYCVVPGHRQGVTRLNGHSP